jgi:hypothetical protein
MSTESVSIKRMDNVPDLQKAWELIFNCGAPDDAQFSLWLIKHDLSIVRKAIGVTAMKFKKLNGQMDREYLIRFASAVMNRLDEPVGGASGHETTKNQPSRTAVA